MTPLILSALTIFLLRIVDMSLDTIRIFYAVRGLNVKAAIFGFLEAFVFIFALASVLGPGMHMIQMLGYAGGFAMGTLVGGIIAKRMATEFVLLRVLSKNNSARISRVLRKRDMSVTLVEGEGSDGLIPILFVLVRRREADKVLKRIQKIDAECFVVFEPIEKAVGGIIPNFSTSTKSLMPKSRT